MTTSLTHDRRIGAGPAPQRTHAQRMDALQRANTVRIYRAELKRRLKAGSRTLIEVLESVDEGREPLLDTMKLYELLTAAPRLGAARANAVLREARCSPSKTLGGLSRRQRREVAAALWIYPSQR